MEKEPPETASVNIVGPLAQQIEKIVAVIRSREISLTLFYQQLAQCKAIYDKHAVFRSPMRSSSSSS